MESTRKEGHIIDEAENTMSENTETEEQDLAAEYEKAVRFMADNNENTIFTNKGSDHAAIVLTHLLRTAKDEVIFFSGNFNSAVTDDANFLEALESYAKTGKKLYACFDNLPEDSSNYSQALSLLHSLKDKPSTNIKIITSTQQLIDDVTSVFVRDEPLHFAIADKKAYRVEIDANEYKASCNFNEPESAIKLHNVIIKHFES